MRSNMERVGKQYSLERTRPNGTVLEIRHNPLPDGGFVSIYTDITERKQDELRLRSVLDHVLDGIISIVGSANFDNRSLELNDELNHVVSGTALAERLTSDFEDDLRRAKKLDLHSWRERPIHIKAREKMWNLFGEIF